MRSRPRFAADDEGTSVDLAFFLELSEAARSVTLDANVPVADNKAAPGAYDPVTAIDRAAERALRGLIEARFPGDGIDGEEYGSTRPDARRRWSLDPVDGTRALICGLPSWTTLVALVEEGVPTAGMIDAPVLDELVVAAGGRTQRIHRGRTEELRTSGCTSLVEARLSTTDPFLFDAAHWAAFECLRNTARVTRFGLDALAYARLAAGHIDLVAEAGLQPHDWHALAPVVRNAGGTIGNWHGGEDMSDGQVLAAATRDLFDAAVNGMRRELQRR
jgi:histidinol phosphatase-like enzyme (inositol monophosphatase family)